ncbi:MAG: ATP-binding cassette domain-containing protein, partial [Turicibacter sp.]|nr:ATP-binding cassette domain-containing protein [Turicibacter sp.]
MSLKEINKSYKMRHVLDGLDLEIKGSESIAIQGRSGSGKTTLINIMAGLNRDYYGSYTFENEDMSRLSDSGRAKFRREKIGIITQHFDLLEDRNVKANIALGLAHLKLKSQEKKKKIREMLDYMGLAGYEKKRIDELSGGEKQRVA